MARVGQHGMVRRLNRTGHLMFRSLGVRRSIQAPLVSHSLDSKACGVE